MHVGILQIALSLPIKKLNLEWLGILVMFVAKKSKKMKRDVMTLIDGILKPANLLCKSLDSVILHDLITLRAHHSVIENSKGNPY